MAAPVERPDLSLVVGGAKGVWDDLRAVDELVGGPWPGWIVVVNDIATHDPRKLHEDLTWDGRVDSWVSLHPRKFKMWERERSEAGLPATYFTIAHGYSKLVDEVLEGKSAGSSGLFAVYVSLDHLGAQRVVLTGVPMTKEPHFDESRVHTKDSPWTRAKNHWPQWKDREPELRDVVKSMSGRTRQLLGGPTRGWLGLEEGGE